MRQLLCVALVVVAVVLANAQDFDVEESNDFVFEDEAKLYGSAMCSVCDLLMRVAKTNAHRSQSELTSVLRLACKTTYMFSKIKRRNCYSIVDEKMSLITKFIKTKMLPRDICHAISLC
uniref:Saposin B-type domain-containing protein n=1 Tax=Plectus sambesii TaxID=2011161 RepID=A0A914WKR9_9BILA